MSDEKRTMTRKEFLKRTTLGVAATAIALKFGGIVPVKTSSNEKGQYVGTVPPLDKNMTWIDSSVGGVMKYWNGKEWTPVKSTWG